jgi:hypothetical protein
MLTHLVMKVHLLLKVFRLSSNGEGEPNFFSEERTPYRLYGGKQVSISGDIERELSFA